MTGPAAAAVTLLERGLNAAIRLDPEQRDRLRRFSGRRIRVEVTGFPAADVTCSADGQWQIDSAASDRAADLTVNLPASFPLALALPAVRRGEAGALRAFGISLSGDVELARDLGDALAAFAPDWEEFLARGVGDVAAHSIGATARRLGAEIRHAARSARENLSEYAQYEAGWLPSRGEAEHFFGEVDLLRAQVDRLAERIRRLQGPGR